MQDRLDEITRKLSVLRARAALDLGIEPLEFEMSPCATEDELLDFEAARRVRLPEEYRAFLQQVGNGCVEPGYGVCGYADWDHVTEERMGADDLDQPSSLDPDAPPKALDWAAADDRLERALAGTLLLRGEGCTYYTVLGVTGKARGRVIHIDVGGQPPSFSDHGTFLDWYEAWLDEKLEDTERALDDKDIPADQAELLELLRRGVRIRGALRALYKQQLLDPEAVERAAALLTHEDPRIRSTALELLARHGSDRFALALPLLRDPDPEVREAAVSLARDGPLEAVEADLLSMSNDPNPAVLFRALRAVPRESITLPMVLPMLLSPSAAIRTEGAEWFAGLVYQTDDEDLPPLLPVVERLLEDTVQQVASTALYVLKRLKAPHLVERIRAAASARVSDLTCYALEALAFQDPDCAVPVLEKHLGLRQTWARDKAAELLGVEFYGPETRPHVPFDCARVRDEAYLLDLLARHEHEAEALSYLRGLREVRPELVQGAVERLEHDDPDVRVAALDFLHRHGRDRFALAYAHLVDPHPEVRRAAVELASWGPPEDWEAKTLLMLNDSSESVVYYALGALPLEPRSARPLAGLLGHADEDVRRGAGSRLRQLVSAASPTALAELAATARPSLTPHLASEHDDVRALVATLLERLEAPPEG